MSYIEDKLKEMSYLLHEEGCYTDNVMKIIRTSLEEYRKEFMSCIPEKRSKHGIYGENLATDWTMGFDDARQELLSKISKKGL